MPTRSRSHVMMAALLAACALIAGCVSFPNFKAKDEQTLTGAHSPDSSIDVAAQNGAVQITADDSATEVTVVATISAVGDTQEEADQRLEAVQVKVERRADGTLMVYSTFPDGYRGNDSCSFDIRLPSANGAAVDTSNGAVTLTGLSGDAEIQTSNGSIRVVRQQGGVKARTSNGRVEIVDAIGPVDVESSNGSVEIVGLSHSAVIRTSNGRVTCRATETATGSIRIRTSNGSVTLAIPASLGGTIVASTSNSSVTVSGAPASVEGNKQHRTIRLKGEGEDSTIETSNGSITVEVEASAESSPGQ